MERCQADESAVSDGGEDQGADEVTPFMGQERIVFWVSFGSRLSRVSERVALPFQRAKVPPALV